MAHSWLVRNSVLLSAAALLGGCGSHAEPVADCGQLQIDQPWVAPAHTGSREMLGYFVLRNTGSQPVAVHGVASADFDRAVFQNKTPTDDADAGAAPLAPFTVAAGQAMAFEPGQREIALYSPTKAYRAGDTIDIELACGADRAPLHTRAVVRDEHGDLPAPDNSSEAADIERVLEDGRNGGGPGTTDDSKTAS